MSFFSHHTLQKYRLQIFYALLILILSFVIYLYFFPICYEWHFSLKGVFKDEICGVYKDDISYYLNITGSDYDYLGNKVEVINIKIDMERTKDHRAVWSGYGGMFVFSEYRLPFLLKFSTTPIKYELERDDDTNSLIYYDRISKEAIFIIEDKRFEITQRGKFLVYDGISILIERDSTLNIYIDKNGKMFTTRQYYRP